MYNLNWTQAQEAMRDGKRVRNSNFTGEEFFYIENGRLLDEEGYPMAGWYRGYDWQDEGWMVLGDAPSHYEWKEEEIRLSEEERQKMKDFVIVDNAAKLGMQMLAAIAKGGTVWSDSYDFESDYCGGITTPKTYPIPREKQDYNFRITKGRGHNKLQKRKKK